MKILLSLTVIAFNLLPYHLPTQSNRAQGKNSKASVHKNVTKNLYIDVHHLGAGKVTYADVAKAHAKDLATEKKFGVSFLKYWVDEKEGTVYCLSSAANKQAILNTHAKAHGLIPDQVYLVKSGVQGSSNPAKNFYLDVHKLGAGKVTAKDVAAAHKKDLAVEGKYGVNFINYWVNEKSGTVMCLSQAPDTMAIINTHKEAHGLIPAYIEQVKQGE